jgi:hypothetical protein
MNDDRQQESSGASGASYSRLAARGQYLRQSSLPESNVSFSQPTNENGNGAARYGRMGAARAQPATIGPNPSLVVSRSTLATTPALEIFSRYVHFSRSEMAQAVMK